MKLTHYIYLSTALAMLTACGEDIEPVYTVGEADNAIVLSAGVIDAFNEAHTKTRAEEDETAHLGHTTFIQGTKLQLEVRGTWTGHKNSAGTQEETITKYPKATIGSGVKIGSEENETHNLVKFDESETIYWDDYGTADPKNKDTGRAEGLSIYGIAVNNKDEQAPAVTSWTNHAWTLDLDQKSGWSKKDLLISNNVKDGNTYKFSEHTSGKLLEFTHAMSKVTVVLHAGDGFPSYFEGPVYVTLKGFYYSGTVNIEGKSNNKTGSPNDIEAWREIGDYTNQSPSLTFSALVFPGSGAYTTGDELALLISADGNEYKVKSAKIKAAMAEKGQSSMQQGYNYIFDITVNKTDIDVTATIVNWDSVKALTEAPVIDFDKAYGYYSEANRFKYDFDFYRSTAIDGSYLADENHGKVEYANSAWTLKTYDSKDKMYWPNHSLHYYFRGVWPMVATTDGPNSDNIKDSSNKSYVEVFNSAYQVGKYPSDLMIGRPLKEDLTPDETCKKDPAHTDTEGNVRGGICATEGKINMNFRYMMSQVVVELKSEGTSMSQVTFNNKTKVEILDCYENGAIMMGSCKSDFNVPTAATKVNYSMHNKASEDYDTFHDAVIPQLLVDNLTSKNPVLRFRVSVADESDGSPMDQYETIGGISSIPVTELDAANNKWSDEEKIIYEWEPGKKYTYTLNITKTEIKVTATVTDWIPVQASTEVWF